MSAGLDPTDIIACAMRPAGSLAHLASLVAFVVATWWVARARPVRGAGPAEPR